MLPQIKSNDEITSQIILPSYTYKMTENRITGYVDELEAIKQAVYHILMTERYSCDIYNDNYGVEFEQYYGKDLAYVEATINDTLNDALLQDERILNVLVTDITQQTSDTVLIKFTVECTLGDITLEVNLNV